MATRQRPQLPPEHLHELADVERLLHRDDRALTPDVQAGPSGARVTYETWELNEHARGSLTASVVSEIAATSAWGVATVHDPMESPCPEGGRVQSMLTVVYDPPGGGD